MGTTEKNSRFLRKHKIKNAPKPNRKIIEFTNPAKDRIETKNKYGVHKINCNHRLSYIGQTERRIEERSKGHERNVRFKPIDKSAVVEYILTQGDEIVWENTTLLYNNHKYKNRIVIEAIEIYRHKSKKFGSGKLR